MIQDATPGRIFRRELAPARLSGTLEKVAAGHARGRDGMPPEALLNWSQEQRRAFADRMRSGTYRFSPYRERLITKGRDKKPRVISLASARDQLALKLLANTVQTGFGIPSPELPQWKVGRLKSAWVEGGWTHYARIDIKEFFDSIPHSVLISLVKKKVRKPELVELLRQAISTPTVALGSGSPGYMSLRGIPQGLPISNVLAELVLREIDLSFENDNSLAYFRYVDDVLILTKDDSARRQFEKFAALAETRGLSVHAAERGSKSAIERVEVPFDYLGYEFHTQKLSVRSSSISRLEAKLAKTITSFNYALGRLNTMSPTDWKRRCESNLVWRLNLVISGCILDGQRRGWLTYYSQIDDLALLMRLDRLVIKLLERVGLNSSPEIKTFIKTWWALNRPSARRKNYILDLDDVDRPTQVRVLVQQFHLHLDSLTAATNEVVSEIFKARMRRLVSDLESDIGVLS